MKEELVAELRRMLDRHYPVRNCLGCGHSLPESCRPYWYVSCTPSGVRLDGPQLIAGRDETSKVDYSWTAIRLMAPGQLALAM